MIFDENERTDTSAKLNRESEFCFLNRSARSEISKIREFVESCASRYPDSERSELIARIKSGNDTHFKSAMFELLLYTLLKNCGCMLEAHPNLQNGSNARPDFLVTTQDGCQFYLEAVLASEDREDALTNEAQENVIFDKLSAASHPNFVLSIEHTGSPKTQPSGKTLVRDLLKWLDSLNPDEVLKTINERGLDAAPTHIWQHEGWTLKFRPIPFKSKSKRERGSLIGTIGGQAGWVDGWSPIRNAIKSKGSKYGNLGKPFLIAVNMNSFRVDRIDEMQALYGQERFVINLMHPEKEPGFHREPNGAWYGKSGPQYTRVSGAWIFNDLTPYTIAGRSHTVYFNPWASLPLPKFLKDLPHAEANDSKVSWVGGRSLKDIFSLSERWPE